MLLVALAVGFVIHLRSSRKTPVPTVGELSVRSMAPPADATGVGVTGPIEVRFSAAPARNSPLPRLLPTVAGHWSRRLDGVLVFSPEGDLLPGTTYTIVVPGGAHGVRGRDGQVLARSIESRFTVGLPSALRLEQLLAELDYLPVEFAAGGSTPSATLASEPTLADLVPLTASAGNFSWRFADVPSALAALWTPGDWSVIDQGAVMTFEAAHQLTVDGEPGPEVWAALLRAVAAREIDPNPYEYLEASETLPERLDVWSDGALVVSTPANTGATGATTPLGTWPIRLRLLSATMSGTNPNGTKYVDHGVPDVAYFYGSDAVHGFYRASYGFPQSNGCVEVPLTVAPTVYGFDPIGSLVSVVTGVLPT